MATRDFAIVTRAPQPAAVLRRRVRPQEISAALGEMLPAAFGWVMSHGAQPAGAPFVRYLSMDDTVFDIEAGVPADKEMAGDGEVLGIVLPGGEVARAIHVGPYEELGSAHDALREWLEGQGRIAGGAPWESYITDPGEEPDMAKWETEVVYPLA